MSYHGRNLLKKRIMRGPGHWSVPVTRMEDDETLSQSIDLQKALKTNAELAKKNKKVGPKAGTTSGAEIKKVSSVRLDKLETSFNAKSSKALKKAKKAKTLRLRAEILELESEKIKLEAEEIKQKINRKRSLKVEDVRDGPVKKPRKQLLTRQAVVKSENTVLEPNESGLVSGDAIDVEDILKPPRLKSGPENSTGYNQDFSQGQLFPSSPTRATEAESSFYGDGDDIDLALGQFNENPRNFQRRISSQPIGSRTGSPAFEPSTRTSDYRDRSETPKLVIDEDNKENLEGDHTIDDDQMQHETVIQSIEPAKPVSIPKSTKINGKAPLPPKKQYLARSEKELSNNQEPVDVLSSKIQLLTLRENHVYRDGTPLITNNIPSLQQLPSVTTENAGVPEQKVEKKRHASGSYIKQSKSKPSPLDDKGKSDGMFIDMSRSKLINRKRKLDSTKVRAPYNGDKQLDKKSLAAVEKVGDKKLKHLVNPVAVQMKKKGKKNQIGKKVQPPKRRIKLEKTALSISRDHKQKPKH